jgi:hypothetical protein
MQIFKKASSAAQNINIPPTTYAPVIKPIYSSTAIVTVNKNPIAAANFLGGAKIGLGVKLNVLEIPFAFKANSEGIVVNARNAKSIIKK